MNHALWPQGDVGLVYFGKVPCRADFIRSHEGHEGCALLDQWGTQTLAQLSQDPHWKRHYDQAQPFHFAVWDAEARGLLAGHWLPSHDEAGRRFPWVSASHWDALDVRLLACWSPVCLDTSWARLGQVSHVAHAASDLAHAQASLDAPVPARLLPGVSQDAWQAFMQARRWGDWPDCWADSALDGLGLDATPSTRPHRARQSLLTLGLWRTQALDQRGQAGPKLLRLPPTKPSLEAHWWTSWLLSLVCGSWPKQAHTLSVFKRVSVRDCQWWLGFQGLDVDSLHALIEPRQMAHHSVSLLARGGADVAVAADPTLQHFSCELMDPRLPLDQVAHLFDKTFRNR